ncbi:Porin Gram-negative type [Paraburkholderia ribeironis]|uniref:Porin Gram-negative type n=1 Tax=Paraburkholderia ribeironis TaxID=1247936 RepID=A0A1N7S2D8_9BURK|nr:porin [Paraburkholderia ribeironis]SIT41509.1 Porin Gram-negative type [Paraburkholderia ribeironis]
MNKHLPCAALAALFATGHAHAQSSVTLYGVIDNGLNFTSNARGHSTYTMVSGDASASNFGLKGAEDLGGGLSAIFTLENGFNVNNGALSMDGKIFSRQAFVGLSSATYGTLTFGRQYDATVDMWSPFTAAGNTIGDLAAHPFDNDNADQDFRFNNAVKYVSPTFLGFQAEGVYGFSNATNFAANRAYSAGISYGAGPFSAAVAYLRQSNGNLTSTGAVGGDGVFTAARQQNIGAGVKWTFGDGSNVGLAYSHVDVYQPTGNAYAPDIGTQAWSSWKFDNVEINGQYFIDPVLSLAAAYTFTHGNFKEAAGRSSPNWHQVALMLNYSLSKRTSVYAQGAYQHTNGKTGTDLDLAHIVGAADLSSNGIQAVVRIGILHHF